MCFFKFFKKKKKDRSFIGIKDLLPKDMVDYDMKTWEVQAKHKYDYEGEVIFEWQLKTSDDNIFLEIDDAESSSLIISRKIPNSYVDKSVFDEISSTDEAPQEIEVEGKKYFLDEISSGYFFENSSNEEEPFIAYDYTSEDGKNFITIEQWGERSFEVCRGENVYEYQFTNFLPGN
ncbi:MAG: DUF4178 domain-containing protein [Desulforegulaceae bacterium]|jgi:hypothetical protein|nr:DUF4178 domain-containing protein [Desulforegulaceae bacterium]